MRPQHLLADLLQVTRELSGMTAQVTLRQWRRRSPSCPTCSCPARRSRRFTLVSLHLLRSRCGTWLATTATRSTNTVSSSHGSFRRQPTNRGGDGTPLASAATPRSQLPQRLVRRVLPHGELLPGQLRRQQQLPQRLVRQALPHGGLLLGHLRRQQQRGRQQETVVSGR